MKKQIAVIALSALLASPAFAGKFNLSEYKTVAVQPVLSASNTRGQFEAELASTAAGLSYQADKTVGVKKAANKYFDSKGFGFAGKASGGDIQLLAVASAIGMLPVMMKLDAEKAKQNAAQLAAYVEKIKGSVAADVTTALSLGLQAVQTDDMQTALKAFLVAMAIAGDSISKGSERQHGYISTGLYMGIATTWAAAGAQNTALANLAAPLVTLLEQDAAMGAADRQIAAQLKIVGTELNATAPNLQAIVGAIEAASTVKPD
jgi:hypothetical protein